MKTYTTDAYITEAYDFVIIDPVFLFTRSDLGLLADGEPFNSFVKCAMELVLIVISVSVSH